jgi:hypothetical protein
MTSRERRDDDWIPSHKLPQGPIRRCADDLADDDPDRADRAARSRCAVVALAFPEAALII